MKRLLLPGVAMILMGGVAAATLKLASTTYIALDKAFAVSFQTMGLTTFVLWETQRL